MNDFHLTDEEREKINSNQEGDDDDIIINNKNIKRVTSIKI